MALKAQSSLEQLLIVALAVALIAIAFSLSSTYSSDSLKISQAQDAVDRLAATADYVYSLGPNSKEYATVYLPEDISLVSVSGNRILFTIGTSAGSTDVFASSNAQLIGSLPNGRGKQKVLVQYLSTGRVVIGEAGLSCEPSYISHSASPGDAFEDRVNVTNNAIFDVTGVTATLSGTIASLASITQELPETLPAGEWREAVLGISIPEGTPTGVYGGYLAAESDNDGSCITQFTLHVSGSDTCAALCAGQGYSQGACRSSPSACVLNGEDYMAQNDYSCTDPSFPSCCCGPTDDEIGPRAHNFISEPAMPESTEDIVLYTICNDTDRGGSYILSAEGRVDGGALSALQAVDGAFSSQVAENSSYQQAPLPPGQHLFEARCTDTANNTGDFGYYYFNVSMADTLGPIVTYLVHTQSSPTTFTNVSELGTATELYTGGADIAMCYGKVDDGDWFAAEPLDGAYDEVTEDFNFTVGQLRTGMHTIYARCEDSEGNMGGIANDSFGVSAADIMLILDVSGSMADPVTYEVNNQQVQTTSGTFTLVKTLSVYSQNTNNTQANITVELRTGTSGCRVDYEARINDNVIASGSRTSTSWGNLTTSFSMATYPPPFDVQLYIRKNYTSSCTAYNRNLAVWQRPSKLNISQEAAKMFVDIVDNSSKLGLVSYSTSATTVRTLAGMGSGANKTAVKDSINAFVALGSTCIECGIDNAVAELLTARSRYPEAVRVGILLTDGMANVGDSIAGGTYARNSNVTVHTIGFGTDVDENELLNIALVTGGNYYFAPDETTLRYIYSHIGQ